MSDNSLLQDFIIETGEHLEETERNLLRLEQQPGDADVLNDIFRSIHTIKGSSEYLGLERVAELSHKLESLLDLLRRGEREVDSSVIDLLIGTNDRIGQLLDDLSQDEAERAEIDDLVIRIESLTGDMAPVSAEEVEIEAGADGESEAFEDEYDDELFGIFVDQLRDGLQALLDESGKLVGGEPADAALDRYEDRIGTLSSSSNYMGYDKLKQIYEQWSQTVTEWRGAVSAGEDCDWETFAKEVTSANIDRIKSYFSKVAAIQEMTLEDRLPVPEATDRGTGRGETDQKRDLGFDDIGMELLTDEKETGQEENNSGARESQLFSEQEDQPGFKEEKIDNSLLQDFIIETGEHLEETERNLLRLEQQPGDADVLNDIFRSIHTIKGSSEYLGLERVAELSHKLESLLDLLRRGEREVDSSVIDLLIGTNDRIGQLLDDLSQDEAERAEIDDLVIRIESLTGDMAPVSAEEVEIEAGADGESEAFEDEYDDELFGIFVDQLRDGLQALLDESGKLVGGEPADAALDRYEDRIGTLSSSSNYMGYDKLKQIYEQWSQTVTEWRGAVSAGEDCDWETFAKEVTSANIDRIKSYFSKVAAIQEMTLEDRLPAVNGDGAEDADQSEPMSEAKALDEPEAMMPHVDDSLLDDFIEEASEHLDEIEHHLMLLEKEPDSIEVLNELFRSIHTIKGSSEYLGMLRIAELSHKLENLLDLLRQETLQANRGIIDTLMEGRDRINQLVAEIAENQTEQAAIEDLVSLIDSHTAPEVEGTLPKDLGATENTEKAAPSARYEETYDQELFAIFKTQLKEGIIELSQAAERLKRSSDASVDILSQCKDRLSRLRSSANYMEYDDLKSFYDEWIDEVGAMASRVNDGELLDMEAWNDSVMAGNLNYVCDLFDLPPETLYVDTVEASEMSTAETGDESVQPEPAPQADTESVFDENPVDVPEVAADADVAESDVASMIDTYEEEIIDDQSLLSRLENAFDARFDANVNSDFTVDSDLDVVKELFSDEKSEDTTANLNPSFATEVGAAPDEGDPAEENTIEGLLFSDASPVRPAPTPKPPKPLVPAAEPPTPGMQASAAAEEYRSPSALGRRQSDRFRERVTKQSIRVDAGKIDTLMNQVGELVVTRAGFNQLFIEMRELQLMLKQAQKLDSKESQLVKDLTNRINEATVSLGRVTSELQENVMGVRMLPIAQLFSRYPRVVYDLVRNTDKKVELDIRGEETELDRMVIEQISDPLIHIIRNAVDHGVETTGERQRKGKGETGILRLEAYHEGNYVVIEVSDDGRGIDAALIRAKALSKGFIDPEAAEKMSDEEMIALITQPGFSTADEVTHTSGRGVGMDVVKDNIEKLNGTLEIEGRPGRGALFRIKIPLTLAIIQALMVRVCDETFTIPLSTVDETIRIHRNEISTIEGMEVYYLRETTLPLIRLTELFKMPSEDPNAEELFVVVVNTGTRQVGLVVDQLKGREEVVIKPLEDYLQEKSGFSGATILGDGNISLILDVSDLVYMAVDLHARKKKASSVL